MYSEDLENLIGIAIADGVLADKDKMVLTKKAVAEGVDPDEFELVLKGRLQQALKNKNTNKANLIKCPNCGETINGLSKVCPTCNYVLTTVQKDNSSLEKAIETLEDLFVKLKALPKPSAFSIIKPIALSFITVGLYIVYKKLIMKQHVFSSNNVEFDTLSAQVDKQIRAIRTSYGDDKRVKQLIEELTTERNRIVKQRQMMRIIAIIITILIIAGFFSIGLLHPEPPATTPGTTPAVTPTGK